MTMRSYELIMVVQVTKMGSSDLDDSGQGEK